MSTPLIQRFKMPLSIPVIVYAGLLGLCVLLVSPIRDFPLNDDWLYARMAADTLEAHRYVGHPFAATGAILQSAYGAAVIAAFGFSYTALRLSTLPLAFLTVWATYRCAREIGAGKPAAALAGLVVLVNPLFVNLSYTFMSDVPFLAMIACSNWGYLRAFRTGLPRDLMWGSVFAGMAMLIRQMGILQPAVFAIAWLLVLGWRGRIPGIAQLAAFVTPILVASVVYIVARNAPESGYVWPNAWANAPVYIIALQIVRYTFASAIYAGLFLLPIAAVLTWRVLRGHDRWTWVRTYWFVIVFAWLLLFGCGFFITPRAAPMPIMTNLLRNLGVGPLTLHDTTHLYPGWSPVMLGGAFWWTVTVIAIGSAALLAVLLSARFVLPAFRRAQTSKRAGTLTVRHAQWLFLVGIAGAHFAAMQNPWITIIYDRYLLPSLIPCAVLGCALISHLRIRQLLLPCAICAVSYAFSVVALQDYLAWNQARWNAIAVLREQYGATDQQIEGGFEFNGTHTSDEFMRRHDTINLVEYGAYGWWTIDPQYAVSFLPRDGWEPIERLPYFSWLGMEERAVYVLQRVE